MTSEPLHVPQASFGGDQFWARLNRLADNRGHEGHPRWLVGDTNPDNRYRLWCQRCDVSIVELMVDRASPRPAPGEAAPELPAPRESLA